MSQPDRAGPRMSAFTALVLAAWGAALFGIREAAAQLYNPNLQLPPTRFRPSEYLERTSPVRGIESVRPAYGVPGLPGAFGGVGPGLRYRRGLAGPLPSLPPAFQAGREIPRQFSRESRLYQMRRQRADITTRLGAGSVHDLTMRAVSGLSDATDWNVPLGYNRFNTLRSPELPLYPEPARGDPFQTWFGLEPPSAVESAARPPARMSQAVEENTESRLASLRKRAEELFREATGREVADRSEKLAQVQRLLTTLREMSGDPALADLLLIHASLGRNQVERACEALYHAARVSPGVFGAPPDLARYFGDAEYLRRQLLEYAALADQPERQSLDLCALQAYCAWAMGDHPRAHRALARMQEMSLALPPDERSRALRRAMEAGLR